MMFKKLAKQLKKNRLGEDSCFSMTSPVNKMREQSKKSLLRGMSKHALDLYERKTDITNFTRLALSNPENTSHEKIVDELFCSGKVADVLADDVLFNLSHNEKFLKDLGL